MAVNLQKLAANGRAFDNTRPFTPEELESLMALEGAGVTRVAAAEYIRNGILTVEEYEVAVEAGFVPKSLDAIRQEAIQTYQEMVRADLGFDVEGDDVANEGDDSNNEEGGDDDEVEMPSREELEAQATALGIAFAANHKDATIFAKIQKATNNS